MKKILELQENLENLIIDYDKIIKKNVMTEVNYNHELSNLIQEVMILEGQIEIFNYLLGNSEEEITKLQETLDTMKKNLFEKVRGYVNKVENFKRIYENNEKYSEEEIAKLEEDYENVVRTYHPAVTLSDDERVNKGFGILRNLYIENDCERYYELKKQIPFTIFDENCDLDAAYERINSIYSDYQKENARILTFTENFAKLESLLVDEMELAREESSLRQRIYVDKSKMKDLSAQINNQFGGKLDFSF